MVKLGAAKTRTNEHMLRQILGEVGVLEWEFMCECGEATCHESVFLTLDAFEALRDSGEAVLAPGHRVSQIARARRIRSAAQALLAQADQQVQRAKKNLGRT